MSQPHRYTQLTPTLVLSLLGPATLIGCNGQEDPDDRPHMTGAETDDATDDAATDEESESESETGEETETESESETGTDEDGADGAESADEGSGDGGEEADGEDTSGGEASAIADATLTSFAGEPILHGQLCSPLECVPIAEGAASVSIPAQQDVELWIEADGYVDQRWQFSSGSVNWILDLIAGTELEAELISGALGVTMDPAKATIAQAVASPHGVTPRFSGKADGPYFIDFFGAPAADQTQTPPGGGLYLYFNVEPGDHEVTLAGCIDDDGFWGIPYDESIDLHVEAGNALGLFTVTCGG